MGKLIKFKKGTLAMLPTLAISEPGFVNDPGTERLYIGTDHGNIPLPNMGDIAATNATVAANLATFNTIGVTHTTADLEYYISPTGNDNNDGLTVGTPFSSFTKLDSVIPQTVNHTININLATGTYSTGISIKGRNGLGSINFIGGADTTAALNYIIPYVQFNKCTCGLTIKGISTNSNISNASFVVNQCISTQITSCVSTTSSITYGLYCTYSKCSIITSILSNKTYAIYSSVLSDTLSNTNTGTGNTNGLQAVYGGKIAKFSTQPGGTTAEVMSAGGKIINDIPSSSLVTNGYRYNDDGTIEQWGSGTYATGTTITFPLVFPNNVYSLSIVTAATTKQGAGSITTSNFVVGHDYGSAQFIMWRAIGK